MEVLNAVNVVEPGIVRPRPPHFFSFNFTIKACTYVYALTRRSRRKERWVSLWAVLWKEVGGKESVCMYLTYSRRQEVTDIFGAGNHQKKCQSLLDDTSRSRPPRLAYKIRWPIPGPPRLRLKVSLQPNS